jgi:hypothetical protein
MEWGPLILVVLVVVLIVVLVALKKRPPPSVLVDYPYRKSDALFTPAERSFLGVLDQMIGDQYRIMGKVRIADIISVIPMKDKGQWQTAFNRISAKHFDFLLCDKDDLSPIAAIELDDKSHSAEQRRRRDEFISDVCETASLRLFRIPARQAYTRSDIERLVVNPLNPQEDPASSEAPNAATAVETAVPAAVSTSERSSPTCPKCSSSMVLGTVKSGARAGERLWGCHHYPRCRGILPVT